MIDRNKIKEIVLQKVREIEQDSEKARQTLNLNLPELKYSESDIEMFMKFFELGYIQAIEDLYKNAKEN